MSEGSLVVEVDEASGVFLLRLRGELDMNTVDMLRDCFQRIGWGEDRPIVVDLRELSFIDSSGLHAFLGLKRQACDASKRLFLVRGSGHVARVFEVAGIASEFEWVDRSDIG